MQEITSNLYPCAHCSGIGTCSSSDGNTCSACVAANELKGSSHKGLPCGICGGLGSAEPRTERINKRITPVLALMVVIPLVIFTFILAALDNKNFGGFLAFSGTVIGTILGFYFSAKSRAT
jgi:hypothetical protein